MAEVAIVASAIQFIDVGGRLLLSLSRLCSKVHHVPEKIENLRATLQHLLIIAEVVKSNHVSSYAGSQAAEFNLACSESIKLIKELASLLDNLTAVVDDGPFRRTWKAIVAVKKEKEILDICERLEQYKTTLSLWLFHTILVSQSGMNSTSTRTLNIVQQTQQLGQQLIPMLQNSQQSISSTSQEILQLNNRLGNQQIIPLLESIQDHSSQTSQDILQLNRQLNSQQVVPRLQGIQDSSIQTGQVMSQLLTTACANAEQIQNMVKHQKQQMEQQHLLHASILQSLSKNPSFLQEACDSVRPPKESPRTKEAEFAGIDPSFNNTISPRCSCRPYNKTAQWQLLPFLQIRHVFRSRHYSFCPLYTSSKTTRDYCVRLFPPKWLLAQLISITFQTSWGAGGCSISPCVIGTKRIVDRNRSPAFQAVKNAKSKLWNDSRANKSCIKDLEAALTFLFSDRKASPLDEDDNGNTLLFEVTSLYTRHSINSIDSEPGNEYLSLIQHLMKDVEDINAIALTNPKGEFPHFGGGTVFDLYAYSLHFCYTREKSHSKVVLDRMILDQLRSKGAELSRPINRIGRTLPPYRVEYFKTYTSFLRQIPEEAEQCGHDYLAMAILQKSEKEVLRALMKVNVNRKSPINGLTALHFAIEWPWALRHLLGKNADINAVDHFGRSPVHLAIATGHPESAVLLLQADSTLESPTVSLLQLALQLEEPKQRDVIIPPVVDALANRYSRLLQLGRAILPEGMLSALGIKPYGKAPNILDALSRSGVSVPPALRLDDTNVYDTSQVHGGIRLSPQYAEKLWSGGFRDIDTLNHNGLTPLLQSWYDADFEMVSWYVGKGVSARSQHQRGALCGLHLYAARLANRRVYFSRNADSVNTNFALISDLQRDQTLHHDKCSCICAPQGCTPASILAKLRFRIGDNNLDTLFPTWCRKTNPSADLLELSAREYTRAWLCDTSRYPHTCCEIDFGGVISSWSKRDHADDETPKGTERAVAGWMRHYDRVRKEYDGPLEDFPRFFVEEVKFGSLASEPDFEDCHRRLRYKKVVYDT